MLQDGEAKGCGVDGGNKADLKEEEVAKAGPRSDLIRS